MQSEKSMKMSEEETTLLYIKLQETESTKANVEVVVCTATNFGNQSTTVRCPRCLIAVGTRVEMKATSKTHCCCCWLCLLGGWLCCSCFCPYLCQSYYRADHYCPNCDSFLGSYPL